MIFDPHRITFFGDDDESDVKKSTWIYHFFLCELKKA